MAARNESRLRMITTSGTFLIAMALIGLLGLGALADGLGLIETNPVDVAFEVVDTVLIDFLAGLGIGVTILLGVAAAAILIAVGFAAERSEGTAQRPTLLGQVAGYIQGAFIVIVLWWAWTRLDSLTAWLREGWVLLPILGVGWIAAVYFRQRQHTSSASTAVDRTRRSVIRESREFSEATVGWIVLVLGLAASLANGAVAAFANIGDPLAVIAPELAYIGTVVLGYFQLKGSSGPFGVIPSLNAIQWVGVALLIGAAALWLSDRS